MTKSQFISTSAIAFAAMIAFGAPAQAAKQAPVELTHCDASYGTIAVVEGDTQGWSKFGLGSPRELVTAIAQQSGCFQVHSAASATPADFLVNVIAGDEEEVDQGVQAAKGLATDAFVRSGAAGQMLGSVPGAGALMGMFGGLGGKKKVVAAGIRVVSPANGQTLVAGTGEVKKSTLSFASGTPWVAGANTAGYADSKDGKMLTEAFIIAYNSVVSQAGALSAVQVAAPAAEASATYTVAIDTNLYASANKSADKVRALRADTELTPTGSKAGLFVEVSDNYGTKGWVSVEDLR
ncbi:SH3 domain-containing protein [uncultured Parasphingorhabdus sp.]|uniref:SH3 domain-containing protein n=1 Tax=uncultured Parasphingorhabdus sp. TaxID=2709694 RepID=UPI0030DC2621|tara:strand:- start:10268 stop:11149 length:882 start_codon:yes stop_codon:yes gene_type:complete